VERDFLPAEVLQLPDQVVLPPPRVDLACVVVGAEIVVAGGRVGQQVPDDGQHGVADGDESPFLASPVRDRR
jgi:hypothetical protein